jgi:hypothetical protein
MWNPYGGNIHYQKVTTKFATTQNKCVVYFSTVHYIRFTKFCVVSQNISVVRGPFWSALGIIIMINNKSHVPGVVGSIQLYLGEEVMRTKKLAGTLGEVEERVMPRVDQKG